MAPATIPTNGPRFWTPMHSPCFRPAGSSAGTSARVSARTSCRAATARIRPSYIARLWGVTRIPTRCWNVLAYWPPSSRAFRFSGLPQRNLLGCNLNSVEVAHEIQHSTWSRVRHRSWSALQLVPDCVADHHVALGAIPGEPSGVGSRRDLDHGPADGVAFFRGIVDS